MKRYSVIMAGGGGTRFWPLSRKNTPKQLLNIIGEDIMINETIKRCEGVIPIENSYIVTNINQEKLIKDLLIEKVPRENVLVEPVSRNTAPCILYAALVLMKKQGDGIMCVFPSDHHIDQIEYFKEKISDAISLAEKTDKLITIGIKPSFPSTGYGYIRIDRRFYESNAFIVQEFIEKPDFNLAKEYITSSNYLWNSGMFAWKISVIIDCFKRFLPRIYGSVMKIMDFYGSTSEQQIFAEIYPTLQSISIDYGIMERSNDVLVVQGDFGWNDVGSWDALGAIFPPDENGNIVRADFVGIETEGCIIYGKGKTITTLGLQDMIVVNTDDALLVCPKTRAQDVKKIVDQLERQKREDLL